MATSQLDKQKAKHILERWSLGIKKEDRRHSNMPPLFESVVYELVQGGIPYDVAYDAMKEAAKLMYPAAEAVRHVYKSSRMAKHQDLVQFTKTWHESLDKQAMNAFYTYYQIEGIDETKVPVAVVNELKVVDAPSGVKTEDELNEEDFWRHTKLVSKDKPWLFDDED